jgi:L-seryl-tRNA(Ser) seleniumtransferase
MPTTRRPRPRGTAATATLRRLPQVHELLEREASRAAAARHGRRLVTTLLRAALDDLRRRARRERLAPDEVARQAEGLPDRAAAEAAARTASTLVPVINATGVVLHTNLGRAPLPVEALRRIAVIAGSYSTLEYDVGRGGRGSRANHLERLLGMIFPGRGAHVVNNNAAALLLALDTLAHGREVLVSRGELVEIGGSFRVPEIMAKSGAVLREVGTTNRTRLQDYERAIGPRTALILKVHPSNYRIVGFTAEVALADLAALARRRRVPLLMDQGSGNLVDLRPAGVRDEPTVHEVLRAGPDLVCFSGDKLLGGPQAGILVGRPAIVSRLRANPLSRALRADKIIYAAMEAVLRAHLQETATADLPVLRMITLPRERIEARARDLASRLVARGAGRLVAEVVAGQSLTGGGSAPGEGLPTALVAIKVQGVGAKALEARLRRRPVPVIARIEADALLLDLRTVAPSEEPVLEEAVSAAAAAAGTS